MEKFRVPFILLLSFWTIAILLWQITGNIFLLYNFGYIGSAVGFGVGLYVALPRQNKPSGRRLAQLLVGVYMLFFLGIMKKENMQLEGFFFYLLAGLFSGAVIHYLVAKIVGPVLFGRGYCGWSCWTAMVLDYLPYKINKTGRLAAQWERLRYVHFSLSLLLVLVLWFIFKYRPAATEGTTLAWLITGNMTYFTASIALAYVLKDNRAFCKYLCPITPILKATARFSFLKIGGDQNKCTQCGTCNKNCPMDINIMQYVDQGNRVQSTECIFCLTCTNVCPEGILAHTLRMDIGGREYIQRR